jgi:hypothetical protein
MAPVLAISNHHFIIASKQSFPVDCVETSYSLVGEDGRMVKNRYFYIHISCSFKVSDGATFDKTQGVTVRHNVTCSVSDKNMI